MVAMSTSLETSTSASTVPSVVTPPVPVAYAREGDMIERHFLFQTHHRPLNGQKSSQQQQQGADSTSNSPRRKSNGSGKSPRKDKEGPSTRSNRSSERFRRLVLFFRRLMRSLRRRGRGPQDDRLAQGHQVDSGEQPSRPDAVGPGNTFTSSEPSSCRLDYLQVDESEDDTEINEDDHEAGRRAFSEIRETGFSTSPAKEPSRNHRLKDKLKEVPKMMKIVDKLRNHGKAKEDTKITSETKETSTHVTPNEAVETLESSSSSTGGSSKRGPRYHPKLLDLYTVTDHVLGVGTFATVKEIKLKSTGQSFALKIILKRTIQGKGGMLDTEIAVLSKVRHPNCVSLLEMFETEDAVYLVTDLAEGGELFDQLLQKGYYTEADAARLVHQILLGVEYLHSLDIVHRDLKPENLLFADKSENARLMITDFGLSKVLTGQNDVLMTACGTPGYVAPEVLEQIGHGKPVDLWSLGVIAYTLLCGYTPFWGEDQALLFENIISGEYQYEEAYWKDISPLAKSFIDSLLIVSAEKRPTASQALNHPWFRAMLDQTVATPSPTDTVNLMPSVKKNFNATNVFKKAVRAVGMLRKLQASESKSRPEAPTSGGGSEGQAHGPANVVSFHDIVNAALVSKRALASGQECPVKTDSRNSSGSGGEHERNRSDSDENLNEVSAILEGLATNP
ncbi:Calcium/calmodulin-dependent protein kinase type 1 [Podila clonocystis]|nr:Calcium/calmodulin-dependent protein kinase type 1 [Podila clonocystis]